MVTVATFLWYDPRGAYNQIYTYGPAHVNRMRSMLARHLHVPHELVCVTDQPEGIDGQVRIEPLDRALIGGPHARYPKLMVFHPAAEQTFGRRIFLLDLDTVIVRDITPIVDRPEPLVLWENSSFGKPGRTRYNSSLLLVDAGARCDIWMAFERGTEQARHDQEWVTRCVGDERVATWNANGSDGIYKARDIGSGKLPEQARLVTFAGRQDPSEARTRKRFPWIKDHWR